MERRLGITAARGGREPSSCTSTSATEVAVLCLLHSLQGAETDDDLTTGPGKAEAVLWVLVMWLVNTLER